MKIPSCPPATKLASLSLTACISWTLLPGQSGSVTFEVFAGTYNEQVTLRDCVYVYGGFAGTESSLSARNWASNISIIDGQSARGCVVATLLGYRGSAIDGFTMQHGRSFAPELKSWVSTWYAWPDTPTSLPASTRQGSLMWRYRQYM